MAASEVGPASELAVARGAGRRGGIAPSSRLYWLRLLAANRAALASGVFLLVVVLLALLAPAIAPYDPQIVDPVHRLQGPSAAHLMGTDDLGRDVLTRALYGARVSLLVGASVTLVSAVLGSLIGLVAGYYPRVDTPLMRVMDGLMAFPSILLAIAIMASLGPRTVNVIAALAVVYTPRLARLVRGMALGIRGLPYVESARAIGATDALVLRRYIFLNALSPVIVQCTFTVAYAILTEASLSFLGAGVPPETPTWGNMLQDGERLITRAWWLSVLPGVALFLTVLTLTLLGDGLRDALDPRMRER
ncbi:MAG TPA: ABC transporter permease [Thermomicrobiales bacterium]|nr:ABC transporter permease [Thermomicrobiales bacterium]